MFCEWITGWRLAPDEVKSISDIQNDQTIKHDRKYCTSIICSHIPHLPQASLLKHCAADDKLDGNAFLQFQNNIVLMWDKPYSKQAVLYTYSC